MNILIVGVSGFIGRHLYGELEKLGLKIYGCSRHPVTNINWHPFDLSQSLEDWLLLLKNIDIVINAVGIYQQTKTDHFLQTHELGPKILFDACAIAVVKVIKISDIGAEQSQPNSLFLRSKRAADQYLLAQSQANVVLYPGIVLGEGGSTTEQLLMVAHLPCIPLVFSPQTKLPLVSLQQLTDFIIELINHWPDSKQTYCLLAKEETIEQLFNQLHHWLGYQKVIFIPVPQVVIKAVFTLFPQFSLGAFNQQSFMMMSNYCKNKVSQYPSMLAHHTASSSLIKQAISPLFKQKMTISFLFYINLTILSIIWLMSGISSLVNMQQSRELMALIGITDTLADSIIVIAAIGDILIALLLWLGTAWLGTAWVVYLQLGVMLIYSLILSICLPIFWLHPFAPIVKNLAMWVLSLYLLAEITKKN
jgi:nucleoside-diphosphate-sugar epimerase